MPLLSNLFGSDSESDSNSDFLGVLDAVGSVNFTSESYSEEIDDDGSSETSANSTSLGGDLDIGSILSSITSNSSDSDSDGLFG